MIERYLPMFLISFLICGIPDSIAVSPPDLKETAALQKCLSKVDQIVALAKIDSSDSQLDGSIAKILTGQTNDDLLLTARVLHLLQHRQDAETRGVEKVIDRGFWASARAIAKTENPRALKLLEQLKSNLSLDASASLKFKNLERLCKGEPEKW